MINNRQRDRASRGRPFTEHGDPKSYQFNGSPGMYRILRGFILRVFGHSIELVWSVSRRVIIEIEFALLRLKLRALYIQLGQLVFQMRVAEERENVLADAAVQECFKRIHQAHSKIADARHRLEMLNEASLQEDYAGA